MKRRRESLFLERRSYRFRRLTDGARVLTVLGGLLFCVPVLMRDGSGPEPLATSHALIYFFVVWIALIITSALLSRWLVQGSGDL